MSTAPLYEDELIAEATPHNASDNPTIHADEYIQTTPISNWRKPAPIWMLGFVAVAAISTSGTTAPRVEIYTRTICQVLELDVSYDECRADPRAQASAAQLMAVIATLSGILTTVSAAWWGSLSDRYGRVRVLGFNVGGLMLADVCFLSVAHFWERLPGTYWWFALGPLCEGVVGGISVASTVMHAYISDCSDPTARSRAFSILMGLLFVGMSIGPLLSGYIMRSSGKLLPVFYVSAAIDLTASLTVWFIIPESLSRAEMQHRRAERAQRVRAMGSGAVGWLRRAGTTVDIVSPLAVLLPQKVDGYGKKRRDWTMPMLGAAYGFGTFIQAAIYQQIQYSYVMFGWTSDVVSYWLGAMHIAKAIWLALLFPALTKLLGHLWTRGHIGDAAVHEAQPLLGPSPSSDSEESSPATTSKKPHVPVALIDLWLARAAVSVDILFYALAFATRAAPLFALFTMCISFGTHFQPTLQSVALGLYARQGGTDTGRLLGALTVVSSLSSHIVGPALFGLIYMKTVGTVPGAFYLLQCAALVTSLVLLVSIRLRGEQGDGEGEGRGRGREGAQDAALPADAGRDE